ncbi:predicted protein [Chaetomium globosum CBS 148.51]|uniref:Uncharacterized protein n=1 Tax=Chaetomium globosum (strain ATCC 6205 / CBS 148.51 / DSM 1962 / NBRC 6347 / NRRL 1970) TaxID=306901 RepID=Q2H6C4_CHAGB|nr:uncharacterized protein CHGG_05791 [Chaetomium globosum CBS 148.51]EAQ89172.1 predicted protein [Chaetomium globosum CBS 148.51]
MRLTWQSISSFFSSSVDSPSSGEGFDGQKHKPAPLKSTFGAAVDSSLPSPVESSAPSAASDRDFSAPESPYSNHQASLSRTSTATAPTSPASNQLLLPPHHDGRPHTAPSPAPPSSSSQQEERPLPAQHLENNPPDIMSREFPTPAREPTVEDMFTRPPGKLSLQHWVKNCKMRQVSGERPLNEAEAAERARHFEETKRELMADKEKFASVMKR